MQRSTRNQGSAGHYGEDVRKQLIRREMRFVPQQDNRRFTKQLLARLLDEGCNLHPDLARKRFYGFFVHQLAAGLPDDARIRLCDNTPQMVIDDPHPRFHATVKYFLTHLADAKTKMTAAVLDGIEALKLDWQRTAEKCLLNRNTGDPDLQNLVEQEYVESARVLGAGTGRIMFRHILPNALGPIIVAASLGVADAIISESGLSFLGLGIQPPTATWGNMLKNALDQIFAAP